MHEGSLFSTLSPRLVTCYHFDNSHFENSHSDKRWYLIVILIWIFLMMSDGEYLHMLVGYLSVFLRKITIQVLYPFVNFFFDFELWIIYIFILLTLIKHIICKILHWIGCLFVLLMVSPLGKSFLVWCSDICLFWPLPEETCPKSVAKIDDKEHPAYVFL